jgi:tetratricopeptide (TPR) repeat protein
MTPADRQDPFDALQAWLTLLPAAWLAVPGPAGPLNGVPTAVSAATGWTALAVLPAIGVLALRRKPVAFAGSTLLLGVLVLASWSASRAGDPFEARRVVVGLASALALCLCGASLGQAGRRVLLRGTALLSGLWLLGAAFDHAGAFSGALGNTGATAQAALPGAVAGLVVFLSTPGRLRLAGAGAGFGFALYAGLVPVLSGALGLAAATTALLLASRGRPNTARAARVMLLATFAAVLAFGAGRSWPSGSAAPDSAPSATPVDSTRDLGGIEVRWRTWRAAPALLQGDALLLGIGPGQFAREFPPHRDPVERDLSSHGGLEPTPIEVEHAHNDWLEGLLEFGLLGGGAWLGLLLLTLVAAWRALRCEDLVRVGLGAAVVAGLAGAFVHASLLASPGAPAVLWPLFGALLAKTPGSGRGLTRRAAAFLPALAALLVVMRAGPAWQFTRHGAALARLASAVHMNADGTAGLLPELAGPPIAAALRACPDSVVALEKRAEWQHAGGASAEERMTTLARLLDARPYHFATLVNLGVMLTGERSFGQARALFERAAVVDPTSRVLRRNRLLLEYESADQAGMLEAALGLLESGRNEPLADRAWLRGLAARLLLAGRPGHGVALMKLAEPELDLSSAERAYAVGKAYDGRADRQDLADGALALANQLWGRRHVQEGGYETAVRNYFQALDDARHYPDLPGGDTMGRLEYAAALTLAGKTDEAREQVRRAAPSLRQWSGLPTWAGQALLDAGLLGHSD